MPRDSRSAADAFAATLHAWRARLALRHAIDGMSLAVVLSAAAVLGARAAGLRPTAAITLIAVAGVAGALSFVVRRRARDLRVLAAAGERAHPSLRNLAVTALELQQYPERAVDWIRERVTRDALVQVENVAPAAVVPLSRSAGAAGVTLLLLALALTVPLPKRAAALAQGPASAVSGRGLTVRLDVIPPAYLGRPSSTVTGDQVVAPEGSRVRVSLSGDVERWRVRYGTVVAPLSQDGAASVAELTPAESGYIAIEPQDGAGPPRLVSVRLVPDRAPAVRIDKPARDLLLPDAKARIEIHGQASDDFDLAAMSLVYTRISGSGEQFEFREGELPIAVTRDSGSVWRAAGAIALSTLGVEPGDSLVYRMTARDRRAGAAGIGTSDTYFVEVAGPGQVALEGIEMPPDEDRYALSQQMIVIKIQRLRARRDLPAPAVREEAANIAAEQRSVRANFVFLMGGHVEDEEAEAEQSNEIQEGRLENTSRREISRAVAHMSNAEQGLTAVDTAAALREAKLAADAIQRAFGRSRYILRTLPVRSRIDPSRRLSGVLDEAGDWRRDVVPTPESSDHAAARALLADAIGLAREMRRTPASPDMRTALSRLAERAMGLGGRNDHWTAIARQLLQLRDAKAEDSAAAYATVLAAIVTETRGATSTGATPSALPADRLRGAWNAEQRR